MKVEIAPSILSADFSEAAAGIKVIENAGCRIIHLDVMDGHFVPNLTFGPKMIKDISTRTNLILDAHLMVNNPESMIPWFIEAGAQWITFHYEAAIHHHRIIQMIKEKGCKAGISIVPSTPVSAISELLPFLDLILVMTVNPGYGGQSYIPESIDKIRQLNAIRKQNGFDYQISVDGGVNRKTAPEFLAAGPDIMVSGSAFFNSEDPSTEVKYLTGQLS